MSATLPELQLVHPLSVEAAIAARHECDDSRFIAGGTDLLVNMRRGLGRPPLLIDLSAIGELGEIALSASGTRIGAMVAVGALTHHPEIGRRHRALAEAAGNIAGPGHRTMATVGGNLCLDTRCIYYNQSEWWRSANRYCLKYGGDTCHVAPQGQRCHAPFTGDLAPALLALGAEVEIAGAHGRRRCPLGELYIEDGRAHLALASDELVVAVHLPPDTPASAYAKARVRGAIDYPLAGVAAAVDIADGRVARLRIGLTGTNSRPFLLAGTDAFVGRRIDARALADIDRLVQKQVQPMRTTLTSAHYRRLAAAALACRLVAKLSTGTAD